MKISDEKKTVSEMVKIYCKGKHKSKVLCSECQELQNYALQRLEKCPYGNDKGPCGACETKCYKNDMAEKMREVMRYAGPRMILYNPIMAFRHLIDLKKKR